MAVDTSAPTPTFEEEPPAAPERLPKHRYPWPIVVAAVVTLLAAGYSFVLAPSVMHASTDLSDGRAALQRKDYVTAMALLREAYRAQPHSHKVQLAYAEAAFAGGNDDEAMHVLEHVKLSESDWTGLTKVMPAQYQQYFETTK